MPTGFCLFWTTSRSHCALAGSAILYSCWSAYIEISLHTLLKLLIGLQTTAFLPRLIEPPVANSRWQVFSSYRLKTLADLPILVLSFHYRRKFWLLALFHKLRLCGALSPTTQLYVLDLSVQSPLTIAALSSSSGTVDWCLINSNFKAGTLKFSLFRHAHMAVWHEIWCRIFLGFPEIIRELAYIRARPSV